MRFMNQTLPEQWEAFRHCPRCGAAVPSLSVPIRSEPLDHEEPFPPPLRCGACDFVHYFNPISAVGVFVVREDGRCLFIRRGRDPGKGKLAPPGGFVDIGETAEHAAHREIREEVGISLAGLDYLGSWPNRYPAEIMVNVLDLFFAARALCSDVTTTNPEEVTSHVWLDPLEVKPSEMAFPSMSEALSAWQSRLKGTVSD